MRDINTKREKLAKRVFSGALRLGKGTSMVLGLAVMLAVVLGAATNADAAKAPTLKLGVQNAVKAVTSMVGSAAGPVLKLDNNGAGPALDLQVEPGQAPLTASEGSGTATNLDSDRLDGKDSADFARAYKRTVLVSPVGTPQENGAALKDALAGITDASEGKPYLLKLEPGVYDLGAGWMSMKEWVDIEGSGEGSTRITGRSYSSQPYDGTIFMRSNADLRSLTVENTGGGYSATAIAFNTNNAADLMDVTVKAAGASAFNTGLYISNSSPTIEDSTVRAFYALDVEYDGTTVVDGSEIFGVVSADGSHNSNNAPDVRIGASMIDGQVHTPRYNATIKCAASYNGAYNPLTAGCTP